MSKLLPALLVIASGMSGIATSRPASAELVCPRVARPPAIDGKLDDAAWASALKLSEFTVPESDQRPAKAIEARLCFDAQALYLAFTCEEPQPQRIRAVAVNEDDNVWQDDCIEVWIRTGDSRLEFDQFIVNTLGTRQTVRRGPGGQKPQWQAKAQKEARRWTVGMKIPFADVHMAAPQPGDMFELKLGREDHTGAQVALSVWPPQAPYAGVEGYGVVHFERANLLPNPDMAAPGSWSFGKGDAELFESVAEGARRVVHFRAPGRYSTAQQTLKLRPDARYRLEASAKGTAGVYVRARVTPAPGGTSVPYTLNFRPSADYQRSEIVFPTGPTGETLVILGGTESTGKGDVYIADLRLLRDTSYEDFGPAISLEPGQLTVVKKLPVADCRALRGFIGTPVDGTVQSRDWDGKVWEYNQDSAGAGVGYAYHGNDGLHITLADADGFNAIRICGGARVKVYRDCPRYDDPAGGRPIAELPGHSTVSRAWFKEPVRSNRVSFFELADGRLADVSFFRVSGLTGGLPPAQRWSVAGEGGGATPGDWLKQRFGEADRRVLPLKRGVGGAAAVQAARGQTLHLVTPPLEADLPLAAIALDFSVDEAPLLFTASVQDPLNPRGELLGADFALAKPGRCQLVMDFSDQIVPRGGVLWLSLKFSGAAKLQDLAVDLYPGGAQTAAEALAYRKLLLKTYYCSLSEPRPWNGWYTDENVKKSLTETVYGPQLEELLMTLDQCKRLGPSDDAVRQYDEWIWRNYRPRRATMPPFEPKIDSIAGAPRWAVVARQAWLSAREVPRWWIENRMVPTGEFGGEVGDDTDMYQNYASFPMFETDGVAAMIKDGAARLAELAEKTTLEQGLNRRTMDPLHAYEEGLNHEALLGWWFYGDPVYVERNIVAARATEALTVVTPEGHRHFKSQDCGSADLRMDRRPDTDGGAHPLMWHPTFEVAWYSRNPRALRNLREWADGWLAHMEPGKYATSVDVASEKVTGTTDTPLYGGYGGQGSAFLFLYWLTGEAKYLGPFIERFREGSRKTSPDLILPELIHREALAPVGAKLADLVRGAGVAETLVTGDKRPMIEALKRDIAEMQRFPAMYTSAEPFTDRVFLYAIQNASIVYTGGYTTRNKFVHTHAVSWEGFGTDYAALVLKANRNALKVLVYSFAEKPLTGRMRTWTLEHGEYRLGVGLDADGDDNMDKPDRDEKVELLRAEPVVLSLPPRRVTVVEVEQLRKMDDELLRADLALSPLEVKVEGPVVKGIAHNIGSARVESFEVALVDEKGTVRVRRMLGPLEAPLDLVPRRIEFALDGLPADAKGWAVVLDPDNKVAEIYEGNNRVELNGP